MKEFVATKKKLESRLLELSNRARDIDHELSEAPDDDWSENAVESENDEVLESMGSLAIDEIRKIRRALSRIDDETYGTCELCGKQIAKKRLEALPYATTCITCASTT